VRSQARDATITLVFADDHAVTRAGIRTILSAAPDIQLVGEAENGDEVQPLVEALRPQVLLLDLKMPGRPSAEIERWARANFPEMATLILTAHDRDAYLVKMENFTRANQSPGFLWHPFSIKDLLMKLPLFFHFPEKSVWTGLPVVLTDLSWASLVCLLFWPGLARPLGLTVLLLSFVVGLTFATLKHVRAWHKGQLDRAGLAWFLSLSKGGGGWSSVRGSG
jgi:CheY-like chemotaxis protein